MGSPMRHCCQMGQAATRPLLLNVRSTPASLPGGANIRTLTSRNEFASHVEIYQLSVLILFDPDPGRFMVIYVTLIIFESNRIVDITAPSDNPDRGMPVRTIEDVFKHKCRASQKSPRTTVA